MLHRKSILHRGAAVAERLAHSPPTKANRVQYPAGSADFRIWESCRWSVGFLGDFRFPPPFYSVAATYSPPSPSSTLKTSLLRARLPDCRISGTSTRQDIATVPPTMLFRRRQERKADHFPACGRPQEEVPNVQRHERLSSGKKATRRLVLRSWQAIKLLIRFRTIADSASPSFGAMKYGVIGHKTILVKHHNCDVVQQSKRRNVAVPLMSPYPFSDWLLVALGAYLECGVLQKGFSFAGMPADNSKPNSSSPFVSVKQISPLPKAAAVVFPARIQQGHKERMYLLRPSTKQHSRIPKGGETGDPRENQPTNGIVRHDSHMRKSGVTRPGTEPQIAWWEASRLTSQQPWLRKRGAKGKRAEAPKGYNGRADVSGNFFLTSITALGYQQSPPWGHPLPSITATLRHSCARGVRAWLRREHFSLMASAIYNRIA
ncbi:hypothetical protein PR048_009743 [Dryococelus australis]|uniref:Uncharacterized protein n=1 Tax=Dryococelus australis TaxID=614101 RepID=A0ABQ9I0T2_9NEOP|nr:hypothetical protein PR048_009743 [Dryococelus australis]